MQANSALRIVSSLADGCDPLTGEVFPPDHILQQPDVIRALGVAVTALRGDASLQTSDSDRPSRVGQPWTDKEDEELTSAFNRGEAIKALADKHERTPGGVKSRLAKLGLIER